MAAFSITVQNSINSFGPAPADKWGSTPPYNFTWGTSKWGEGTEDVVVHFVKTPTVQTLSIDSSMSFSATKIYSVGLDIDFEVTSETLVDSSGYFFVFTLPTTEAENRALTTFTAVANASSTWTSSTVSATSWS